MGQRATIEIKRLSLGGEGIGHVEGMAVFVPYAAPGDKLEVELIQSHKRFARARIVKILEPSTDRINAPCPYYFRCGGCTWQHLNYPAQLLAKQALVQETLERIGGLAGISVKPVLGMTDPWRYRNKVQQPVGFDGKHLISGFYAEGSHEIIPIDDCLVQPELSVKIINRAKMLFEQFGLRAYDDRRQNGWIRHLLVRTSHPHPPTPSPLSREKGEPSPYLRERVAKPGEGEQALLVFVTRTPDFPQESRIIKALMNEFPQLAGIHQNVNPANTNVILGRQWRRIYGQDYLEERLGPLKFRLSPSAFFQVNSPQAEVLYNVVKSQAGTGERLLDLYTGVGTIALWLADQFTYVGGVEENPAAIRDAAANAALNRIRNVEFVAQSTESFLGGISREARRPVTVVLDPPRAGCAPMVIQSLLALRPGRLIYVSCDPGTLARDLALLTKGGYAVQEVQPVDLFPHTPHIETAVKLIFKIILLSLLGLTRPAKADVTAPAKAAIVLTAQENGLEPQPEFRCQGTIHGYIRLAKPQAGAHRLESRWTSPAHQVAADSRTAVDFRPERSTAYVWFNFPERSATPGAIDPKLDATLLSYNGRWRLDVFWDNERIIRSEFIVHCP